MSDKKVGLVSGANKGIGFETSRQLAQLGIKVLMGARDKNRGAAAVKKLQAEGLDVEFVQLDVTNSADIARARTMIEKKYSRLDILVNNAGIAHPGEPFFQQRGNCFH